MGWISFKLGRPGAEYTFEVPPEAMSVDPRPITSLQRNLAGGLRKATMSAMAPIIKLNSSFLSLEQRNQFATLMGVADTFLSFQCRDDWQQVRELVGVVDSRHFLLSPNSALRLSQALVQQSFDSIITPVSLEVTGANQAPWTPGNYGAFPWGGGPPGFDPGIMTYDDLTYTLEIANPIPDLTAAIYLTYTYTGWLVDLQQMNTRYQGGWLDRATYDIQLVGA